MLFLCLFPQFLYFCRFKNHPMKKSLLLLFLVVMAFGTLSAAYLSNVPYTLRQPNGDTLQCLITGDEYYHYLHDSEGFTFVKNPQTGYYMYAEKVDGKVVPSPYVAGKVDPRSVGLVPGVRISAQEWQARRERMTVTAEYPGVRLRDDHNHGTLNNLVVFIRFADDEDFTQDPVTVYNMFNAPNSLSLKSYYKNASYNQLTIESHLFPTPSGTTIFSYQDSHPRSYYCMQSEDYPDGYGEDDPDNDSYPRTEREMALVTNAIDYVRDMIPNDLDIDFDNDDVVDNICFVIKGNVEGWSDLLWPHMWCLYTDEVFINGKQVWNFNFQLADATSYFSVSVFCHEMFHTLGAPDLYHYDDEVGFAPVGPWDLMGQNGNVPQHSGVYMKHKYGNWVSEIPEITESGTYTLFPVSSETPERIGYRIPSEISSEFFVVEYRKKTGTNESALPGTGMLVYRINSEFDGNAGWNGDDQLDEIYVYRLNGTLTENGNVNKAHFTQMQGRTELSYATNPRPFLSNGYISAIRLYDITVYEDSLTFKYLRPGDEIPVDEFEMMKVSVYPNPASEVLNIETSFDPVLVQETTLYDLNGRKVADIDLNSSRQLSVSNFARGTYVLNITLCDGKKITQKVNLSAF